MQTVGIKEEARRLMDRLDEESNRDDLMYEIYVRQAVEKGIDGSKTGRTTDVSEVRHLTEEMIKNDESE